MDEHQVVVGSRLMRLQLQALSAKLREVATLIEGVGEIVVSEPRVDGGHLLPSAQEIRKAAGLTGQQVAEKIGTHKVVISNMETGRATRKTIEKLGPKYAEAIGVPYGTFEFRRS